MKRTWHRLMLCVMLTFGVIASSAAGAATGGEGRRLGERPYKVLLCKFADVPEEPHPTSHYEDLFSDAYPGMLHYWQKVSYGRLSLAGTTVSGWYQLPGNYYDYVPDPRDHRSTDYEALHKDCAFAAYDQGVDFTQYRGIVHWFNAPLIPTGRRNTAWMSDQAAPHGPLAHEMGHSFGFRHTSDEPGKEYGSGWDVMSDVSPECDQVCIPVHPVAEWKRRAGWIPRGEVFRPEADTTTTVWLDPLSARAVKAGHHRMARIVIGGDNDHYYTVEARHRSGYDAALPRSAVILHRFRMPGYPTTTSPDELRLLIDEDEDGDSLDDGAMWFAGETFVDRAHGIRVAILRRNAAGAWRVRIRLSKA